MNKTLRNLALVALATAPFSAFAEVVGSGTADDAYQIATAEDLCGAHKLTVANQTVYFVQTADIDMAGVKEYIPVVGADAATYDRPLNYDGRNHVIKNFAPETGVKFETGYAYNYGQSIFGVFSGELKNLGIVGLNLNATGGRAGAIGGYLGQSKAGVAVTKVSNVYATGTIKGGSSYTGGLFGTTGTDVELNNCYVNVTLSGEEGALVGGIAGRLNNPATINNCYVAGEFSGTAKLVCSTNTKASTINGLVIFATGVEETGLVDPSKAPIMANTDASKAAGVAEVLAWSAFQANGEGLPTLKYALSGAGTEADPYQIASAEDLCNAWTAINPNNNTVKTYFVQTADIDMEGVEDYHALTGYNGVYGQLISYDGQNHVIYNFAPGADAPDTALNNYYCTSIFGVPSGEIKNLGVVDAYSANSNQGNGILGAYGGNSNGSALTLENVFVHGEVIYDGAKDNYVGGMFGTTGNDVTMTNCFANVKVSGSGNSYTAGLVGRLRNTLNIENVYVAGSVEGSVAALVASTDQTPTVNAYKVIAFNEGADAALASAIVEGDEKITVATAETKDELIAEVHTWVGFSETKDFEGYPALADFENVTSGITDVVVKDAAEIEANGAAVYYNLQGVQVANPDNGIYIVRRGNKVTKELIRK